MNETLVSTNPRFSVITKDAVVQWLVPNSGITGMSSLDVSIEFITPGEKAPVRTIFYCASESFRSAGFSRSRSAKS